MGTSTIANLVVGLEANVAKFSTEMKSAADVSQKAMTGIQDAATKAKSQLISLAASVVSVGAAVQSIRGAIQLGDDLKQMSDTTGIAISKLDQLSIVAKLNGAALGDMAKGFKFLGGSMIQAQDASSKSGQLFTALGVSIKDASGNLRAVDEVMGDVATALESIENETVRAAVGTEIFGKSYQAIAATLRNYKQDQEAANRVLENFGAVSTTAANLADELGDKFTLLGEGSKRALLGALVPGMAAVVAGLDSMIDGGGRFQSGFGQVVSWLAENGTKLFVVIGTEAKRAGLLIGAALAAIATQSLEPFRAFAEENSKLEAEFHATMARISTAAKFPGLDDGDQVSRRAGTPARASAGSANAGRLASILGGSGGAKEAVADYRDEIQKLNDTMERVASGSGGFANLAAAQDKITKDLLEGKRVSNDQIDAYMNAGRAADQQAIQVKDLEAAWEKATKQVEDMTKYQNDVAAALAAGNAGLDAQNAALKLEHEMLGKSDNERQQHITGLALQAAQTRLATNNIYENREAVRLLTEQLELLSQQAADKTFLDMIENTKRALEQTTAFFSDFFVDLFNNGSKAFKNLWENFKQLAFRALADIAAKQVVVSLVGALGIGGSAGAQAAQGLGSQGGLGSLLGGIGNVGSSAAGGIASIFGGSGFTAGLAGDAFLPAALAGGLEGAGLGALGAGLGLGTLGIGAIALPIAVKLIAKLFGKKKKKKAPAAQAEIDPLPGLLSAASQFDSIDESFGGATSSIGAFRAQGEAFDNLLEKFDGSKAATVGLTTATQNYHQSLVALVQQIEQVKGAVDQMFSDTRESIYLAGRDNQFVYDFLQKQADDKAATLGTLSDPAAIQALAEQINANITRAFGLLDEAGQAAKRDEFLTGIDNINAAVQQRLTEVGGNATSSAQSDIAQMREILQGGAAKDSETAEKNSVTADKFAVAVDQLVTTPIGITIEPSYSAVGGNTG